MGILRGVWFNKLRGPSGAGYYCRKRSSNFHVVALSKVSRREQPQTSLVQAVKRKEPGEGGGILTDRW